MAEGRHRVEAVDRLPQDHGGAAGRDADHDQQPDPGRRKQKAAAGFTDQTVPTVSENARTLRLRDFGFE